MKEIRPLRLRSCLTQTPNFEFLRLVFGRTRCPTKGDLKRGIRPTKHLKVTSQWPAFPSDPPFRIPLWGTVTYSQPMKRESGISGL